MNLRARLRVARAYATIRAMLFRSLGLISALALAACATPAPIPTPPLAPQTPQTILIANPTRAPAKDENERAPLPPENRALDFFQQRVTNLYDLAQLPVLENSLTTQFTSRNWVSLEHFFDYFVDDGNFFGANYGWIDEAGARQSYRIVTGYDGAREYEIVPRTLGPGAIERMWFAYQQHQSLNNPQDKSQDAEWNNWGNLGALGNVRFYFDDEPTPRLDFGIKELFVGKFPFPAPLAAFYATANGGNINYIPIPFQKSIRVTTTGRPRLMQIQVKRFPDSNLNLATTALTSARAPTAPTVRSYTPTLSLSNQTAINDAARAWQNCAAKIPGDYQTYSLAIPHNATGAIDLISPATISSLRVRVPRGMEDSVWMMIFWDGENDPALSAPLRGLFGTAERLLPYRALPLGITQTDQEIIFYNNFPMPFQTARLAFINDRAETLPLAIDLATRETILGAESSRLRAFYGARRMLRRTDDQDDYPIVDVTGTGKYVGAILNAYDLDRAALNGSLDPHWRFPYLESNLDVWVDGRLALPGTGIEDDFNSSYYYVFAGTPGYKTTFCLSGLTLMDYNTNTEPSSQYRFYLNDAPEFRERLRVTAQHGNKGNNLSLTYSSTAFWYQMR
ncbi:MAG: DUF2961 domain-containing protein [Chloroflexi bacterium]|nr:DUF2961 domain-containing protein [Chloroflexota bacterium]